MTGLQTSGVEERPRFCRRSDLVKIFALANRGQQTVRVPLCALATAIERMIPALAWGRRACRSRHRANPCW